MHLLGSLPICLLLLIIDTASARHVLGRAAEKAHQSAAQRSHSLTRDLRVALGGLLTRRDDTTDSPVANNNVVYCKPGKQAVMGGDPDSGGDSSSTSDGGSSATDDGDSSTTSFGATTTVAVTTFSPILGATTTSSPSSTSTASSPWNIQQTYAGTSFFNGWTFYTLPDKTNGIVNYVDQNTAQSNGLLEVNGQGNAVMRVETTPTVPGNRMSIRITTNFQFNGGLVIMDSVHMPTGCGTWPAFWTNGPNWPLTGEIDIAEGVNDYTNNQATLHTDVGCTLPTSDQGTLGISGTVLGITDCAAGTTGNAGCGIRASSSNTIGPGFNAMSGGVYAMKWDTTGIAVYFFPRGTEPSDITGGAPLPDTWGTPMARWPASSCDPFKFFTGHQAIFDTTLCGDWAAGVWNVTGVPGQDQSCAQRTGFSTCEAFVRASGGSFTDAYWEVKSVKIYQL